MLILAALYVLVLGVYLPINCVAVDIETFFCSKCNFMNIVVFESSVTAVNNVTATHVLDKLVTVFSLAERHDRTFCVIRNCLFM
jgi:hypothetical protein